MSGLSRNGRILLAVFLAAATFPLLAKAQEKEAKHENKAEETSPQPPPKEESFVTEHSIKVNGQTVPYKATVGSILLKDDKDEPIALLYYTAYTRSDVKEATGRPLSFLYNGGPGGASVPLHMCAFGPRRMIAPDAASATPPPYQLTDNAHSLIDVSDLVFIDPIGTGFSHAVGKAQNKDFWSVDSDVKSLAQFVTTYVSRNNRWNSPKYLIGESYGTYRSVALANYLQSNDGMYFNGVVLVSTVLDVGLLTFHIDLPYILYLPSYAATAWYHKVLQDRPENLDAFLEQARQFAKTEYAAALMKGDRLTAEEKADMAKKLSRYTGLSEDYLIKANLRVNLSQFREELQRSRGLVTGRLDARYSGAITDLLAEDASYDPLTTATGGALNAVFNGYVRNELKFTQDRTYHLHADFAGHQWDWKHSSGQNRDFAFAISPNVEDDLVDALVTNPHLQIEAENGLFDLATPFFATEYTMTHLGLPESLQKNIQMKYYDSGHMMYLHDEALAKLKSNIASFIDRSSKH